MLDRVYRAVAWQRVDQISYNNINNNNNSDDDDDINNQSVNQFFIYLRAKLNSQWPITESALNIKTMQ
jgi:hypothetical protein